jgi:hypothetical protein
VPGIRYYYRPTGQTRARLPTMRKLRNPDGPRWLVAATVHKSSNKKKF